MPRYTLKAPPPAGEAIPALGEIRATPLATRVGEEAPRIDLGLDLSTTCVGWAQGADQQSIVQWGKFVFRTKAPFGERLLALEAFLRELFQATQPERLWVERPLSRHGKTTSRHYEVLGIVRKVWREVSGAEIPDEQIIAPATIKSRLKVKRGGDHQKNKEIMLRRVNELYGLRLKYDDNKRKSDDDAADAIALLSAAWTT